MNDPIEGHETTITAWTVSRGIGGRMMTVETVQVPAGRRGGTWPRGRCRRCGQDVQVFFLHPIVFTHHAPSGGICPGSGMYCEEPTSMHGRYS